MMSFAALLSTELVSDALAILDRSRHRWDWVGPARNAYDLRIDEFHSRLLALSRVVSMAG